MTTPMIKDNVLWLDPNDTPIDLTTWEFGYPLSSDCLESISSVIAEEFNKGDGFASFSDNPEYIIAYLPLGSGCGLPAVHISLRGIVEFEIEGRQWPDTKKIDDAEDIEWLTSIRDKLRELADSIDRALAV